MHINLKPVPNPFFFVHHSFMNSGGKDHAPPKKSKKKLRHLRGSFGEIVEELVSSVCPGGEEGERERGKGG